MIAILLILAPLVALLTWGVVYDLKRRRRASSAHDVSSAARRARGLAEGSGTAPTDPGGGMPPGTA